MFDRKPVWRTPKSGGKTRNSGSLVFWVFTTALFVGLFSSLFLVDSQNDTVVTASPPSIITYQGKLVEDTANVTTTKKIGFSLYSVSTGGTSLYTASGTISEPLTVNVIPSDGIFSVELGKTSGTTSTNSLSPTLFQNNQDLYLEVFVVDGAVTTTLSPRKQLTASPYAFNSEYLSGVAATSTASSSTYIPISNADGSFAFNTTTITQLNVDSGTLYVDPINNRVGIGTTTPQSSLSIQSASGQLRLGFNSEAYAGIAVGSSGVLTFSPNGSSPEVLSTSDFRVGGGSSLFVDVSTKKVGINTSSPYASLSVAGEIVAGHLTATSTATSTFGGGISALSLDTTGSASSTFANGVDLSAGCFAVNGTCLSTPGAGTLGQVPYYAGSGTALTATSTLTIAAKERVGINYTSPTAALDIVDHSQTDIALRLRNSENTVTEYADFFIEDGGTLVVSTILSSVSDAYIDLRPEDDLYGLILRESDGTATTTFANFYVTDATDDYLAINVTGVTDTDALVITASDRVGIGTSSPYAKLSVVGEIVGASFTATTTATSTFSGGLSALALNTTGTASSTFANGINLTAGCFAVNGTCVTGGGGSGTVNSGTAGQVPFYESSGTTLTGTSTLFLASTERVGVNTTTPWAKLGIELDAAEPALVIANTGSSTPLGLDNPTLYVGGANDNGHIGIGTASPDAPLHVAGIQDASAESARVQDFPLVVNYESNTVGAQTGIALVVQNSISGATLPAAAITVEKDSIANNSGRFHIRTNDGSGLATALSINADQDVGIGTTTPGADLHVLSTGTQLRLGYDASNYTNISVDAQGSLTLAPLNGATTTISSGKFKIGDFGENDTGMFIELRSSGQSNPGLRIGDINGVTGNGYMHFVNDGNINFFNDGNTVLSLTKTGAAGINTTTPTLSSKFAVQGNSHFSGNLTSEQKIKAATLLASTSIMLGTTEGTDLFHFNSNGGFFVTSSWGGGTSGMVNIDGGYVSGAIPALVIRSGGSKNTIAVEGTDAVLDFFVGPTGNTFTSGTLQATGESRFYGDVYLGDGTSDTIFTSARFKNSLVPTENSVSSLGSASLSWAHIFASGTANIGGGIQSYTTGTSTFSGGVDVLALNATGSATSTFANGISLSAGCLSVNGTCVTGGGSGTVNSGTTGQIAYYDTSGTAVSGTSSLYVHTNEYVGIGTTTPGSKFAVQGDALFSGDVTLASVTATGTSSFLVTTSGSGSAADTLTTGYTVNTGSQSAQATAANNTVTISGDGSVTGSILLGTIPYGSVSRMSVNTTGSITDAAAALAQVFVLDGAITTASGLVGSVYHGGADAITSSTAVSATITYAGGTGTTTFGSGVTVNNPIYGGGGGELTNNYGVYIDKMTAGATADYGLYIGGADTYALWVDSGESKFDGNIAASSTLRVTDTTRLYGDLFIGDDGGDDQITLNARFINDLDPAPNNGYDLGDARWSWKDVYASGTVYIGTGISSLGTGTSTFAGGLTVDSTTLVVDSSSNKVGVGTAAPTALLESFGTTEQLRLSYDASNYAAFTVASDGALTLATTGSDEDITIQSTAFSNAIFVDDSAGSLGIGTASPSARLHVMDNTHVTLRVETSAANTDTNIYMYGDRDWLFQNDGDGSIGTADSLHIYDATGGGSRMTFDPDGQVGIGTTGPDRALEINESSGNTLRLTYNDSNGSAANYADFLIASDGALSITTAGTDEDITLQTGSFSDALFIDDSVQGIAIGSSTSNGRLYLESNANSDEQFTFRNFSTGAAAQASIILGNDVQDGIGQLTAVGSNFSLSHLAGGFGVLSAPNNTQGMIIGTQHASAGINFYVGGLATSNNVGGFDTTGYFGVNSSTPWGRLSVEQSDGAEPVFVVGDTGTSTPHFMITPGGNVAIGTTTQDLLSTDNELILGGTLILGNDNAIASRNGLGGTNSLLKMESDGSNRVYATGTAGLWLQSQGIPAVFVDALTANVGVNNTSSPWGQFSIEMDTTNPTLVVANTGSSTPALYVGGVNQSGRVGIGTSNPDSYFHVSASTTNEDFPVDISIENTAPGGSAALALVNDSGDGYEVLVTGSGFTDAPSAFAIDEVTSETTVFLIDQNQNVGINNTTTPWGQFSIEMDTTNPAFVVANTGSSTPALFIDGVNGNGDVGINRVPAAGHKLEVGGQAGKTSGGSSWATISDERLKNVLYDLNGSALDTISALHPVAYEWNNLRVDVFGPSEDTTMFGFLAQEVAEVIPHFVTQDNQGYYWYQSGGFEALLTAAIQEQQQQIQSLSLGGELQGAIGGNLDVQELVVSDHVAFNEDTVGQARILAGDTEVQITFAEEYEHQPIVTASPLDFVSSSYRVGTTTSTGFIIELEAEEDHDVTFNWHAFGSGNGKIFVSDGSQEEIELVVIDEPETPELTPVGAEDNGFDPIGSGGSSSSDPTETPDGSASSTPSGTDEGESDESAGDSGEGEPEEPPAEAPSEEEVASEDEGGSPEQGEESPATDPEEGSGESATSTPATS